MATKTVRQGVVTRKRKSRVPWIIWLLVILLIVGWWVLYQSRWFLVEDVKVAGAQRISTVQVTNLAKVHIGEPLVSVNPGAIEKALAEIPQIKKSHIERSWPHTVLIKITERAPVAAVQTKSGFDLVDDEGMLAGHVAVKPKQMRVIVGKPNTSAMKAASQVAIKLPTRWKVAKITAPTQDSVAITLSGGQIIFFGSGEQVDLKVRVASALLANRYKNINVSAPRSPVVK